MTPTAIKLGIGAGLFATWLCLVIFKIDDAADIIAFIKLTLAGLGVYHINDRNNTP